MNNQLIPEYVRQIDDSLARPQHLITLLEAASKEFSWASRSPNIRHVIQSLMRGVTTEQLLGDGVLVAWLPVLVSEQSREPSKNRWEKLKALLQAESLQHRSSSLASLYLYCNLAIILVSIVVPSISIVPVYKDLYNEFALKLPNPTRLLFTVSDFVRSNLYYLILGGIAIAWLLPRIQTYLVRFFEWTQLSWLLGTITVGNRANVVAMARLAETLAELLQMGAPLPDALEIAGTASQRLHLQLRARQLAIEMRKAENRFSNSAVAHNFPPVLLHAFTAGPAGCPSVPLIRQLAAMYRDRAQTRLAWSLDSLYPIVICLVAVIVGFIAISLLVPLLSLITSLS
jgi:type II secretory pathway component PulF